MHKQILVEKENDQIRVAVMEQNKLVELYIERQRDRTLVGNIYKGRVSNVLPGMQAAFVDIGLEKRAFLAEKDMVPPKRANNAEGKPIKNVNALKSGHEIWVQVTKEPGGDKGVRCTAQIDLSGELVVLLPTTSYVGVSRNIEEEETRRYLRNLAMEHKPEGMGVILRTACVHADKQQIIDEIHNLATLWEHIERKGSTVAAPRLLYEPSALCDVLSYYFVSGDVERIVFDDAGLMNAVLQENDSIKSVAELHEGSFPLFDLHKVDAQLDKAIARRIWLKSGGFLVIDSTEALTVIDVNTGKFTGKGDLEQTAADLNREAADEIARQLRLRDIDGIIIIDFIDMELARHRRELMEHFKQALKRDKTRTKVLGITQLGFMEMTRKARYIPLEKQLTDACTLCQGRGRLPSSETIARRICHELRGRLALQPHAAWLVHCSRPVASDLSLLEMSGEESIYVVINNGLTSHYSIEPIDPSALPKGARRLI